MFISVLTIGAYRRVCSFVIQSELVMSWIKLSTEYYISATQSHDKSKAIRYKNRPLQTLYFTGFSDGQKYSRTVSKKVNVYKGLRTMRHEILCNFCYLFNNLILRKPFKNKDLYDTMVDTLKTLVSTYNPL